MGTPVPATSTGCLHPWDQNTPRPWLTRNWFLLWQRWINLGKLTLSIGHTFNDQFTLGKIINLFIKRETRSTTPMKRTLLLSIYTLETQLCLVISLALSSWTSFYSNIYMLFEIVNSFFHPEYEKAPKMTWLDFISSFGGICGLCLGISFVSVTELVYWFTVRFCGTFVQMY